METTSEYPRAEKRVEDDTTDIANQAGLCTIGPLAVGCNPSASIEESEHSQQEDLAEPVVEDEIGPDDAPEMTWDDTNEGVCVMATYVPVGGLI